MNYQKQKTAMNNELNKLIETLQTVDLLCPLPQRMVVKIFKKQPGQILGRDQKAEIRFIKTRI